MSQRLKISIDLDDVLSDFGNSWISLYNKKSGDNLTIDKITDWDLTQFVLPEWKAKIFTNEIVYSKDFFLNVPVKEDAVDFMKWVCSNHDISIVSASYFETVPDKAKWIMKQFPFFDIKNFIPCYHKHKIKADIMIDDGAHNFISFEGIKCFIDRPWNRRYTEFDDCRFMSLMEVKNWLIRLNERGEIVYDRIE